MEKDSFSLRVTGSQLRELKTAMRGKRRIISKDIKNTLDKLDIVLSDERIAKLIQQASKAGEKFLSEEEFFAWIDQHTVKEPDMSELMTAFRVFDKDGNGYICRDELKKAMETIGEPMSEEQLDIMIGATDIDNDGKINYEEFVQMML